MKEEWTRRALDPAFLRGLDRLALTQRHPRTGLDQISRRATARDDGLDWSGHRAYAAGDDLRHLDWTLTARSGRPYVRIYRSEPTRRTDLLVDLSRSMEVGRPSKRSVALALAFALGYLALSRLGWVRLTFLDRSILPGGGEGRGPGWRPRLLQALVDAPLGGSTDLGSSLHEFASRARQVGRAILISDLLDSGVERALGTLRARGFETWVLRLRAREDEDPGRGAGRIAAEDAETLDRRLIVLGRRGREEYRRLRREETEGLAGFCAREDLRLLTLGAWRPLPGLVFEDLRTQGLLQ